MEITQQLTINFFTKFLMLNGEVTIPGIGKFELIRSAARQDSSHNFITPPGYTVCFNPNKLEMPSLQSDYMNKKLILSQDDLIAEMNSFSHYIKGILQRDKILDWPGVGQLIYSESGAIYFEGINFDYQFLTNQSFVNNKIEESSREESISDASSIDQWSSDDKEEVDSTNNRWKTGSLFLLLLVLATLFVRFLYGGFGIFEHRFDPIKTITPSKTYQIK